MVHDQLWVWEYFVNRAIRRMLGHDAQYGILAILVYLLGSTALMAAAAILGMGFFELVGLKNDGFLMLAISPIILAVAPTFWTSGYLFFEYQLYYTGVYWMSDIRGFPIRDSVKKWVQFSG